MSGPRTRLRVAGILALVLATGPAGAQSLLGDTGHLKLPPTARELGLHTGDFDIYPSVAFGWGYNSNFFYEDDNEFESPEGVQLFHLLPGVKLHNRTTGNLKVEFDSALILDYYSSDNKYVSEHNTVGGEVGLAATFFENGPAALTLRERFRRALERRNTETDDSFNRNLNKIGGGLRFRPGGKALEVKADYDFVADLFTDTVDDWGDLIYHDMTLRGAWKFFPFTAFIVDVNWQVRDYLADGYGHYGELTDSMPLKARAGVNGFITKKLSVMALVGWGNSFHDLRPWSVDPVNTEKKIAAAMADPDSQHSRDSYNGPLGEARLSLKLSPTTIVQTGYSYDFSDSLFSNYVSFHEVSANLQQRIADRVDLDFTVSMQYLMYAQLPRDYLYLSGSPVAGLDAGYDRTDTVVKADLRATVDIARYLAFEAQYVLEGNNDPVALGKQFSIRRTVPGGGEEIDSMAYTRHFFLGSLILRY